MQNGVYVTGADFIKSQMVRLAYLDAFSEALDGMRAVCHVIKNRADAGWWGGSYYEILSHHRDYSSRIEPYPDTLPDPRIYSIERLLQEIDGIFSGATRDDVTVPAQPSFIASAYKPALYYAKLHEITSEHFLTNISRRPDLHPRIAQVGQLFFFA